MRDMKQFSQALGPLPVIAGHDPLAFAVKVWKAQLMLAAAVLEVR